MNEVKSIDKSLTVGMGKNSYSGVADKDVKSAIGQSMQKNGLAILPTGIEKEVTIETYKDSYGNDKMRVFTEVLTKYTLLHESGESIELAGYGQGVDSQDKSAGKATTYALKYALLYAFMVPTGKIDDADNTHSAELPHKPANRPLASANKEKPTPTKEVWERALNKLKTGETEKDIVKKALNLSPEQIAIIDDL